MDENSIIGCSLEQRLLLYIFYITCYKISKEKFEKYLQTYKNQQKIFRHISYHQKPLLLRELTIPICYLLFRFVFIYELYYCFTYNYEKQIKFFKIMTEDTSSNDTIITDILDNDISIALEKLILSDKSNSNDVPNKNSKNLSNDIIDIFKPLIIQAIETIRSESKLQDIDAIYRHISKSEATNIDRDFIPSVLNDLENQNVIYNKQATQGLDSYFIASHTDKEDPKNIRSQAQNDNT